MFQKHAFNLPHTTYYGKLRSREKKSRGTDVR